MGVRGPRSSDLEPDGKRRSGNLAPFASANPIRFVQKELAIAERLLRILVDRNNDRLNVLVAPPFPRGTHSYFSQGSDPWRVVGFVVVPLQRLIRHRHGLASSRLPVRRACATTR